MQTESKKRMVWFFVFLLWIGMLGAMVYNNYYQDSPEHSTNLSNTTQVTVDKSTLNELGAQEGLHMNGSPLDIQTGKTSESEVKYQQISLEDHRMKREQARGEAIDQYREMVNNPNTDPAVKKQAQESLLKLTERDQMEEEIESLILARGFADVLARLHDNSIDLIIQCQGLTKEETIQIADIVIRLTGLRNEDINIMEYQKSTTQ